MPSTYEAFRQLSFAGVVGVYRQYLERVAGPLLAMDCASTSQAAADRCDLGCWGARLQIAKPGASVHCLALSRQLKGGGSSQRCTLLLELS